MRPFQWLLLAALAAPWMGRAQSAADGVPLVSWQCWYEARRGPAVACRLAQAPDAGVLPAAEAGLPGITPMIRSDPARLADDVVVIPLYGPATEPERILRLARAVMCGPQPSCSVQLSPPPGR